MTTNTIDIVIQKGEHGESYKMSIEDTLSERQKTHGEFKSHATVSQALKGCMRAADNWYNLSNTQKEALEMIQHKIARILNGDANTADHWHDIAGYATLVERELD